MAHDFASSRITGTVICTKCRLLPLDADDYETPCAGDWEEHESGLAKDPGGAGGDHQRGPTWTRRWQRRQPDGDWQVVTVNAYAVRVNEEEKPAVYDVEIQTENIICSDPEDPGSTEIQSDYEYDQPNHTGFSNRKDATRWAKDWLARLDPTRDLA